MSRHHSFHRFLLCSPGDASFVQVIHADLNRDAVAEQNLDIVHTKLAGNMSRNNMVIGQLHLEGRIGQNLNNGTLKFNYIILWQNNHSSLHFLIVCRHTALTVVTFENKLNQPWSVKALRLA